MKNKRCKYKQKATKPQWKPVEKLLKLLNWLHEGESNGAETGRRKRGSLITF